MVKKLERRENFAQVPTSGFIRVQNVLKTLTGWRENTTEGYRIVSLHTHLCISVEYLIHVLSAWILLIFFQQVFSLHVINIIECWCLMVFNHVLFCCFLMIFKHDCCFRRRFCTVRLHWARDKLANEMNFVTNHALGRSLDMLTSSPARYHCAMDAPMHCLEQALRNAWFSTSIMYFWFKQCPFNQPSTAL